MEETVQSGRGGMGGHKHGISGHCGHSSRHKQSVARDANAELKKVEEKRRKREGAQPKFNTVSEAVRSFRPR